MSSPAPIGIFDSGVGGLSVMQKIRELLPQEDLIYFADSAYCPYGICPPELVHNRTLALCEFMVSLGVKLVVVACNTASSASLNKLRELHSIPIIGMEPALKPASHITKNKRVGILATGVTIAGERFNSLIKRYANGIKVISQPCPGLVELVEAGETNGEKVDQMLKLYLDSLIKENVDTVVLGCTHYPFLNPVIKMIVGDGVEVIDTGEAVAKWVSQVLKKEDLKTPHINPGTERFYTTGEPEKVQEVITKLWNSSRQITVKHVVV
ncbi:MAG: glutamate racemase [Firmicutes bacterium]|nr:glutamate racemase [Bacillota bacterium]